VTRYTPTYEIEISHPELNAYRHIKGRDRRVVEQKAAAQLAKWDEQWERKLNLEAKRQAREAAVAEKEDKKRQAVELSSDAEAVLAEALGLLDATLLVDDKIDWETLKDKASFSEKRPRKPSVPPLPTEPVLAQFPAKRDIWGLLFPAVKRQRIARSEALFAEAHDTWVNDVKRHKIHSKAVETDYQSAVAQWEARKQAFLAEQQAQNALIDDLKQRHDSGHADAVEEHADLVLSQSVYPDWLHSDWELAYEANTKTLVVNYVLPNPDQIPTLKEVRYVASRDSFEEKYISSAEIRKNYDSIVYQICLRTLHELFEADRDAKNIVSIAFNGITNFVNPANGQNASNCICSVQVLDTDFVTINLSAVDPKICFKSLKGVAAASLAQMAPVAPLMKLDRADSRFIQGEDVVSTLSEGENIAAMDWKDFEHLIRQLFEKEFSSEGCEVQVTQGSRDGGVDAVAFDPDPIRGGKIVIQAKRYTNTVGVEAVRDLFGTVVNEGATKGILVTTSQFGPEARKFVAGKPLALIDGSNLLHMLAQHGTKARINLVEAKQLLA
jgi:restriction system protein